MQNVRNVFPDFQVLSAGQTPSACRPWAHRPLSQIRPRPDGLHLSAWSSFFLHQAFPCLTLAKSLSSPDETFFWCGEAYTPARHKLQSTRVNRYIPGSAPAWPLCWPRLQNRESATGYNAPAFPHRLRWLPGRHKKDYTSSHGRKACPYASE